MTSEVRTAPNPYKVSCAGILRRSPTIQMPATSSTRWHLFPHFPQSVVQVDEQRMSRAFHHIPVLKEEVLTTFRSVMPGPAPPAPSRPLPPLPLLPSSSLLFFSPPLPFRSLRACWAGLERMHRSAMRDRDVNMDVQ